MHSKYHASRRAKWLGATCLVVIAASGTDSAFAACLPSGGTLVCDTSAPNPSEPIAGSDILLLTGAEVRDYIDPFAGASLPPTLDSVTVLANGRLETQEGSSITNRFNSAATVNVGAGGSVLHSGSITSNGGSGVAGSNITSGVGVALGANASLVETATGAINATGFGGTALLVSAPGATVEINGIVGNGTTGPAISTIKYGLKTAIAYGSGTITIGSTGLVRGTTGSVIVLSDGFSLDVAGTVRSNGSGSAIDYRGSTGGSTSVVVAAGATVQSAGQPAIIGADGSLNLTIAGTVVATDSSTAVLLGAADDTVTLVTGASVSGLIDAGAGSDALILSGNGSGTLGATANFESATFASGTWTLAEPVRVANGITIAAGATAIGSADRFASAVANNGTLRFEQSTDAAFAGNITGTGALIKSGSGALTLGNQAFAGATLISQGTLVLAGTMPSAITVARGGTLAGVGAVRSIDVQSGGAIAPGGEASIGTITATGDFVQRSGSTYLANIINGTADTLAVGGAATIESGATLAISGSGTATGQYTLLTASGGLTGRYGTVQVTGLGAYQLTYTADSILIRLGRSNQALLALAAGGNARSVAAAIVQLPQASPVYTTLAITPSDATVSAAFGQLTGEIHAALPSAVVNGADLVSDAVLSRTGAVTGLQLWGQFLGSGGSLSGPDDAVDVTKRSFGGLIGLEGGLGDVTVGLGGGYVHTRLRNTSSEARVRMPQVLLYARAALPHVDLQAGLGYVHATADVDRTIAFGGFQDNTAGNRKSNLVHGYAELGVPLPLGDGALTPFAQGRFYRLKADDFRETGGGAALRGGDDVQWSGMSELGMRLATPVSGGLSAYGKLSWQRRFGSFDDPVLLGFVAGGSAFAVRGGQLSRDAAALGLGLAWTTPGAVRVSIGYDGTIGDRSHDNVGRATLSIPL